MYKGIAQDGAGDASKGMTFHRCRRMVELQKVLGFMPFPGSLNLKLDKPFDFSRPRLEADILEMPRPPVDWNPDKEWIPKKFLFWPITLNGIKAFAVMVDGRKRPPTFLEVYAPVRLRDHGTEFTIEHS